MKIWLVRFPRGIPVFPISAIADIGKLSIIFSITPNSLLSAIGSDKIDFKISASPKTTGIFLTVAIVSLLTLISGVLILVLFYLVLGMFMDAMSMLVLTVPIAVPMVVAVGVDPVWFGIFIVVMCEIALITPPVGMNLFVVQGLRKDGGSFNDVIMGSLPYVFIMIGFTALLIVWPEIATWLPSSTSAA